MEIKSGELVAIEIKSDTTPISDFRLFKNTEEGLIEYGIIYQGLSGISLDIKRPYFVTFRRDDIKSLDRIFRVIDSL